MGFNECEFKTTNLTEKSDVTNACVRAANEASKRANCRFAELSAIAIKSALPLCAPYIGTVACIIATQKASNKVKCPISFNIEYI